MRGEGEMKGGGGDEGGWGARPLLTQETMRPLYRGRMAVSSVTSSLTMLRKGGVGGRTHEPALEHDAMDC